MSSKMIANVDMSDEELMVLYQNDNYQAFEILYHRHSGRLYEYFRSKVGTPQAAELLQELFERLHRQRHKFAATYPFLPWLFTMARHLVLDLQKTAEAKLQRNSEEWTPEQEAYLQSSTPTEMAPSHELGADLGTALAVLNDKQKQAIELRYLQDWSFQQIAKEMALSEVNVRQLISRGLAVLRRHSSRFK